VCRKWQSIPAEHPAEHLLAYLYLVNKNTERRRVLAMALEQMDFSGQLTDTIKTILQLQIAFEEGQDINDKRLKIVWESILPAIRPRWERYGLTRVLADYQVKLHRWHVGPMEVLPFNYC
jgi:hypothetical protein